jgi:sulfate adenylyltransferase
MRLTDGTLWPIPVVLDVPEGIARALGARRTLFLRDPEGLALAVPHVGDVWRADRVAEAERVYGTASRARSSPAWAGSGSWRSRPGTPCTARTRS